MRRASTVTEPFEFTDGDGDRIAVRRGPGRGSKVELSPAEGAAFVPQDTLHWNPRTKFLHDDSGRIPLEDGDRRRVLDTLRTLVAGSGTKWLEPLELPAGWEAHVDAATLRPYYTDREGHAHDTPPETAGAPAATSAPLPQVITFRGQSLSRMDLTTLIAAEPEAGYDTGWICDGCQTEERSSAHGAAHYGSTILFHGSVDALDNPLGLNAFDLCARCAADVKTAEWRHQVAIDKRAEQERRDFRDKWHRRDRDGGGGGRRDRVSARVSNLWQKTVKAAAGDLIACFACVPSCVRRRRGLGAIWACAPELKWGLDIRHRCTLPNAG